MKALPPNSTHEDEWGVGRGSLRSVWQGGEGCRGGVQWGGRQLRRGIQNAIEIRL